MSDRITLAEYRTTTATQRGKKPTTKRPVARKRRSVPTRYIPFVYGAHADSVEFTLQVKAVSEANQREHWRTRNARKKKQQEAVAEVWPVIGYVLKSRGLTAPWRIDFTRIGPQSLDSDNLAGAFKHVQDAVCKALGANDADTMNAYAQEPQGERIYGVRVRIWGRVEVA